MAVRQILKDADLNQVSGGLDINNNWGDHKVYKIGPTGGEFTHTFNASDFNTVKSIVGEVHDPSLLQADDDANIMAALLEVEGLLTPIE